VCKVIASFLSQFIKIRYCFCSCTNRHTSKNPLKHYDCFHQRTSPACIVSKFHKFYMCSVPVAIEHWLCDALYVSPTIGYLLSMARSRCVNLYLIHPFALIVNGKMTHIQSSLAIQSKQHYIVY